MRTYVFSIGRGNNGPVTSWSEKPAAKSLFPVPQLEFNDFFFYFSKLLMWVADKLTLINAEIKLSVSRQNNLLDFRCFGFFFFCLFFFEHMSWMFQSDFRLSD